MSDVVVKTIEEIEIYTGPYAVPGIKFHRAGPSLGISAWGMSVLELEAGCTLYPEHDHIKDGQEEVYVVLRGSATLHAGEATWQIETGSMVRVGPSEKRRFVPGADGVTLLAIGGTPGQAFPVKK